MLAAVLRPFYNKTEGRLRALWRSLIQFGIMFMIAGALFQGISLFVILFLFILLGRIPFSLLNNGPALSEALTAQVEQFPLINVLPDLIAILVLLGIYYLLARFLDHRSIKDFGLRLNATWWRDLCFGLFAGAALMGLIFVLELAFGWVSVTGTLKNTQSAVPFWMGVLIVLIHFTFVGLNEELFARGYQIRNLAEGMNVPSLGSKAATLIAFLITSLVFGLLHGDNPNATLFSTFNLVLFGLLLGLGFILTGQLAIPIGMHIAWNFVQGNVFGFPVSGTSNWLSLVTIRQSGPAVWTGGAFGPEGGLLGVFAVLLGMFTIVGWVRWSRGRAEVKTGIAEYRPADRKPRGAVAPEARQQVLNLE